MIFEEALAELRKGKKKGKKIRHPSFEKSENDNFDSRSYFEGQADAIDQVLKRQTNLKECLIAGFEELIDIVMDDSIKHLTSIRDEFRALSGDKDG